MMMTIPFNTTTSNTVQLGGFPNIQEPFVTKALAKQRHYLPSVNTTTNEFPIFGNTPNFHPFNTHNSFNTQNSYPVGCYPHQNNGWANLIQLVLSKLLTPQKAHHPEYTEQKEPRIIVNHDYDTTPVKQKSPLSKKRADSEKAELPKGVTPLSYKALMNDDTYYTEAKDAVKEWQAHLTKYENKLDNPTARKSWIKGAVNYLALLNAPKVRDEFMKQYPSTIGTYYNSVLRTLRENDAVRADMQNNKRNAQILAMVDKTNQAVFEHRIFKNTGF